MNSASLQLLGALCILKGTGLETYTHGVVCCLRPALLGGPGGESPLPAPGYAISEYLDLLCYFRGIGYVE